MKEPTRQPSRLKTWPSANSGFHILTWNPQLINSFTQNDNNHGTMISTFSLPWENRDQLWENQEQKKSSCPDCALVIQGLLTLSYWKRNHNQCLTCQTSSTIKPILIECRAFAHIRKWFFKVNNSIDLFENVKIDDVLSFLRETGLYQKYDELKLVNLVKTNEILLIKDFTY